MESIRYIDSLKNTHVGSDIWVIGAGASMNYVDPSFFENKITIGLNYVGVKYKVNYIMLKDLVSNGHRELVECEIPPFNSDYVVASEWDKGGYGSKLNTDPELNKIYEKYKDKFYFFKHKKMGFGDSSVITKHSNQLFISTSTITSAIHLAAYMGSKNIMICGHDKLSIDGKMYFDGYKKATESIQDFFIRRDIHSETIVVRDLLREVYGCNVYSLNPFVGFDLEGHKYERFTK